MNSLVKKVIIYSMVGIMPIGFGASVIEASPRDKDQPNKQRYEDRGHDRNREKEQREQREQRERREQQERRQRERDERMRKENERHEREMRRRHHESEREWHKRQERERERHNRELRDIAAILIGIVIGSSNN